MNPVRSPVRRKGPGQVARARENVERMKGGAKEEEAKKKKKKWDEMNLNGSQLNTKKSKFKEKLP